MAKAKHPQSPAPKANRPQARRATDARSKPESAIAGVVSPEASPATPGEAAPVMCPYCKTPCKRTKGNAFFVFFGCECSFELKQPREQLSEHLKRSRAREDYSAR